jgi:ribose 5-phosphate isomerase B
LRWYVASDHAGFALKTALANSLVNLGDEIVDMGPGTAGTSVDYPIYAEKVARAVAEAPGTLGLLICGTGIGVSIVANKIRGVRAARATDVYSARLARAHNDANILCLGERVTGVGVAEEVLHAFRDAHFEGGRHERRVEQIKKIEQS